MTAIGALQPMAAGFVAGSDLAGTLGSRYSPQDSAEPSCLRFDIVPVSRMSGMMKALGTMHSAWRAKRLPLGRSLTRL